MSFAEAIGVCFQKYATFAGRARRAEYWWWTLFSFLVSTITMMIDLAVFPAYADLGPVSALALAATFLPGLSVTVRRLHDLGRSGWWVLIILVPVLGLFILIYWTMKRGDPAGNIHGPNPIPDVTFT